MVQYHTPPEPLQFPTVWLVSAAALAVATTALLWSVFYAQARSLRNYAARLRAVGLGIGWSRRVLAVQCCVVGFTGIGLGAAAGMAAITLFLHYATRATIVLTIPWAFIGFSMALAGVAAAAGSALGLAALNSRPVDNA